MHLISNLINKLNLFQSYCILHVRIYEYTRMVIILLEIKKIPF